VVGAIGAIKPKSGKRLPDFIGHRAPWPFVWGIPHIGLLFWPAWPLFGAQHFITHAHDSQAIARANNARGVANNAITTVMAWMRRMQKKRTTALPATIDFSRSSIALLRKLRWSTRSGFAKSIFAFSAPRARQPSAVRELRYSRVRARLSRSCCRSSSFTTLAMT
jgi:hypothetical protein